MYIDFHCHPALKPYGKSFKLNPQGVNSPDRSLENSIWFTDPKNSGEEKLLFGSGIPAFTQSDFRSLFNGDCRIVCASLYPIEKKFLIPIKEVNKFLERLDFDTRAVQKVLEISINIVTVIERLAAISDNRVNVLLNAIRPFSVATDLLSVIQTFIQNNSLSVGLTQKLNKLQNLFQELNILFINGDIPFNILYNAILEVGVQRLNRILQMPNYFDDLIGESNFYTQQSGTVYKLRRPGSNAVVDVSYVCINRLSELPASTETRVNIGVVSSIEGGHVFNTGLWPIQTPNSANDDVVLLNVDNIKTKFNHIPFFVTLGHHFYNELVGHSATFITPLKQILDQEHGQGSGITELGWKVINKLLRDEPNELKPGMLRRKIYIDVKHMSPQARYQYYNYLYQHPTYNTTIPIIVSHGGVNGLHSPNHLKPSFGEYTNNNIFFCGEVNFYDDELVKLKRSKGLFCIQLDKKRIASLDIINRIYKDKLTKIDYNNIAVCLSVAAELLFQQMRHFARIVDNIPQNPNNHPTHIDNMISVNVWDNIAIGSDFDGIIDPLWHVESAAAIPSLEAALLQRFRRYCKESPVLKGGEPTFDELKLHNRIPATVIVNKFFRENGLRFLQTYFI